MASLEEALAQSIDNEPIAPVNNDVLVIDPEKRLIDVPDSESLFGVFGENIVERKYFTCPRIILNNIDLFECYIFINYISASGRIGYIQANDVVLDETENYIVFSWELTSNVFDKNMDSIIYFSVSAKQYVDDREPVFFTRKAQGKMYETVNGTEIIQEQYADIILQLLAKMDDVEQIATPEAMQAYVDNWLKENPSAIGGQPVPVESASGMLNTQTLYLYMGQGETVDGVVYERGYVYYYVEDTQSWTKGSLYGGEGGGSSFSGNASDVSYDDTETKLGVENVQDAIGKLSEEIVDLDSSVKDGSVFSEYAVGNLKSLATDWLTNQYYYVSNLNVIYAQDGDNYTGFILKVKPNTDYSCTFARFVLRMIDKTNVIDKLENVTSFNSGNAEYVAISFNNINYPISMYCINKGNELYDSELKYNPVWLYHPSQAKLKLYNGTNELKKSAMSDGNVMELDEMHTKKNTVIMFKCDISNLSKIEVGHGRNLYLGSSVEITSDSYTIYKYMSDKTEVTTGTHDLTLSDFLSVTIITNDELKAKIIIGTSSGTKIIDNVYWDGATGKPFALLYTGYTTNNVLKYKCADFKKDICAFGDSFVTLGTNERWVYYVKSLGFDNWLLDGFGGRNSAQAIISFRNVMKIAKPKYVLWLLGMNDSDSDSSVNESWKSCVDEVINYCKENDIVPILATIPCTPSNIEYPIKNKKKNDYVKSLGVRYIDFAKAVGAENDGDEWYNGMRASDVHPLAKGAEALAHQAFIDMPELLN